MYVSKKHHVAKRAGLKNRGYFELESDYEDFEGFIEHDMQASHARMKDERKERVNKERVLEYRMG